MSDLDEKLEELLEQEDRGLANEDIQSYDYPVMAAKIKQAFIDAGWVKTPTASITKEGWIEVSTDRGVRHNGVPLMTGQEWEEKALKEGWRRPNETS